MKFKNILTESKVSLIEVKILNALLKLGVEPDFQEVYEALIEHLKYDYSKNSELMDRIMTMYDAHYYDYEDSGFKELMGTEFDEVEYQENIVLDSRVKALALHQNVPVFLIKNEYGDYYTDMSSDEEYLILTDSEADREAESRAESYLDEGGLSSVNSDYLTTDWVHIKQICEDDANEYVRNNMDEEEQVEAAGKKDDYDDLTYDIDEMESEMIDIEEEVGVLNDDIESLIDGFKDEYKEYLQLKNRLDSGAFSDEDEKEDLLDDIQWKVDNLDSLKKEVVEYRNEKIKLYKRYRDLKYDIKVLKSELEDLLSDIEDEAVEKYAQDRFDDIEYSGAIKWFWDNYGWETKQLIENGILDLDKEEYFETVRNERATWLAPYDHDENYETVGDETYYIFRHN
jgi:predicted  nucleic acid-binding Zn-ribbon protein